MPILPMQCIFCEIIRGKAPAEILYRTERAVAILDIHPIHFGHALIFPSTHAASFLEVPEEELAEVMRGAAVVSRAIVESLKPHAFNIFSNNGEAAGQSVFHFHFHITPRYENDDIRFILKLKDYPDGEMNRYAELIRKRIQD